MYEWRSIVWDNGMVEINWSERILEKWRDIDNITFDWKTYVSSRVLLWKEIIKSKSPDLFSVYKIKP